MNVCLSLSTLVRIVNYRCIHLSSAENSKSLNSKKGSKRAKAAVNFMSVSFVKSRNFKTSIY